MREQDMEVTDCSGGQTFLGPAPNPTPHLQPHPQLTPVLALDKKLPVQVSDQLGRFWGTHKRALP